MRAKLSGLIFQMNINLCGVSPPETGRLKPILNHTERWKVRTSPHPEDNLHGGCHGWTEKLLLHFQTAGTDDPRGTRSLQESLPGRQARTAVKAYNRLECRGTMEEVLIVYREALLGMAIRIITG